MRPDDVVHLAEQSTLGGLLLRPDQLDRVRGWLRTDDFAALWHGRVYDALVDLSATVRPDPHTLATELADRHGPAQANLPRLAGLLHVTPPDPDPVVYARMVVDGGLRREIAGLGVLLQAAAADGAAGPLNTTCSVVDAALDLAGDRWATATSTPHDAVVTPLHLRAAAHNTGRRARIAASRALAAHPARDAGDEHAHTVTLIGALIAHPDLVPAVTPWLPASRIEDPGWRAVYATTVELAELGQRVDLTTVAWTTHTRTHHGPTPPDVDELTAAVDAGWLSFPPQVLRDVAVDQLRHLADVGANHLRTCAANPGVLIGELVDAGHTITTALRTTAAALPDHAPSTAEPAPHLATAVDRDARVVSR